MRYNTFGLRNIIPGVQSLLSLAGFPEFAGIDKNARISASQFVDFKAFFSATVSSVRSVARLWNERTPSLVLAGFDIDQAKAAEALQSQPAGTFLCFFSMQAQFAGNLVVACKVCCHNTQIHSTTLLPPSSAIRNDSSFPICQHT